MRQITILVVDDDQDDIDILNETLMEAGRNINLMLARNGREALEMLTTLARKPDLIFLDFNMPIMNGKECLAKIKRQKALKHIPVVMHCSTLSPRDEQHFRTFAFEIYPKGLTLSKSVELLQKLFARVDEREMSL